MTAPHFLSTSASSTRVRAVAGPLLAVSVVLSLTIAGQPTSPTDHEKQLATLESSWAHLIETKATEEIDRLLAESYFSVDSEGRVIDRRSYLNDLKSGKLQIESLAIE